MTDESNSAKPEALERKGWLRRSVDLIVAFWTRIDGRLPNKPPSDDFTWTMKL